MLRRRRPLLRAAAVGGTAYVAGKHVANRRNEQAAQDAYQDQQISDLQAQQQYAAPAPEPAPAPAAPSADDNFEQLQRLGEMHEQGILTDDEFTAAKQKILRTM